MIWEVRPCKDRLGNVSSYDICLPTEPGATGVAVVASVYSGEAVANEIAEAHNRELLRAPAYNSGIIDELLSLKPFLEAHHCRTGAIDKAVELLRVNEPAVGELGKRVNAAAERLRLYPNSDLVAYEVSQELADIASRLSHPTAQYAQPCDAHEYIEPSCSDCEKLA